MGRRGDNWFPADYVSQLKSSYEERIRELEQERDAMKELAGSLVANHVDIQVQLQPAEKMWNKSEDRIADLQTRIRELEQEREQLLDLKKFTVTQSNRTEDRS